MLRPVRYLQAVVDHANFTRAAEALHVSQPALSQQIRQLEDLLGAQLLDRSGRTVRLTEAGTAYLHYAAQAVRDLEAGHRAVHDVADLSRGSLRLATAPTLTTYLVGPLMDRFNADHPGIMLRHIEMAQSDIEAALADDRLDIAIAFPPVRSADIDAQILLTEKLRVVVGADHPLAGSAGPLPASFLAGQSWALLTDNFTTRGHIDAYFAAQSITPTITVEVNTVSALIAIVERGRLITIMPAAVTRANRALRALSPTPDLSSRPVALLRRRGAYQSAAARAFGQLAATMAADWM